MEGGEVNVIAISKIKPEHWQESRPTAEKLIAATRNEEGNLRYDWYRDANEEGTGVCLEHFKNMEAFQAHASSEHIKEAGGKFKDWSSAPTVVRVLKPENVSADSKLGDESSFNVVVIIQIKPESIEVAKPETEKLIEATRKENGLLRYDWYQDIKEAGVIVILECYTNEEAFNAHCETEEMKAFLAKSKEWLKAEPEVRILKPEYVAKK